MKKIFVVFILAQICTQICFTQEIGLELLDRKSLDTMYVIDSSYNTNYYNDVWGWVDENNNEFAILGTLDGAAIYKVTDSLELIQVINKGVPNLWGDCKSFKNYIYGTDESPRLPGIWIKNMDSLETNTFIALNPEFKIDTSTITINRAHNLFVDEFGYLYVVGGSVGTGVAVFDLNEDPTNPLFVGHVPTNYCHDVMVQNNLMVTSNYYSGNLNMFDVTDKKNPLFLSSIQTGKLGTHNAWLSDDNNYVFTTDEKLSGAVESYDIHDKENIVFLDSFRHEFNGVHNIPHNTHYHNGYLVTSYYTEGLIVLDAHRPEKLIQVARYDTHPERHYGFKGNWGAYPYLPSGKYLASDMQRGLFLFKPTFQRAAYIEGKVYDKNTNESIENASIRFLSDSVNYTFSDSEGAYLTGTFLQGEVTVEVLSEGFPLYQDKITLTSGETLEYNIYLDSIPVATNHLTEGLDYSVIRNGDNYLITTNDNSTVSLYSMVGIKLNDSPPNREHQLLFKNLTTGNYVIHIKTKSGIASEIVFIE